MKKIIVILILFLSCYYNSYSQNEEVINAFTEVDNFVQEKLEAWMVRGKYEPASEYEERVSLLNRNKQIEIFTKSALQKLAPKSVKSINRATLGGYDPDTQLFTISMDDTKELYIKVLPADAHSFETNWGNYYFTNIVYGLYNYQYVIYSADLIVNNKLYEYKAVETAPYGSEIKQTVSSSGSGDAFMPTAYSKVVRYVSEKVTEWKKQGEFENSEAYALRTSAKNIKEQENLYTKQALDAYAPKEIITDSLKLGIYQPDLEKFPVIVPNSMDIELTIPAKIAPKFKENWKKYKITEISYGLYQSQFVINTLSITTDIGEVYFFNALTDTNYGSNVITSIDLNNLDLAALDSQTFNSLGTKELTTVPPQLLVKDFAFTDTDDNNRIDANEAVMFTFTIENRGKGVAYNVEIKVSENNKIKELLYAPKKTVGNIPPGESKSIEIPVEATLSLESKQTTFTFEVIEANGFDADKISANVEMKSFQAPNVVVADKKFITEGGGTIELGKSATLKILIQNRGLGIARSVQVKFTNPENVLEVDKKLFTFDKLLPNETQTINYEFMVNKRYAGTSIPIRIDITESYGKYGDTQTPQVSLEERLAANTEIIINATDQKTEITTASFTSDVDKDIPEIADSLKNDKRFALIFGNENYSKYQKGLETESNVDFATNDALVFKEYASKVLGIPEDNIILEIDAGSITMNQKIEKLIKYAELFKDEAELIFYYSGHGFPDEKTNDGYIIPVDVSGQNVTSGIKLSELYKKLSDAPAKRVTVFIDACFSGGGRTQGLLAAKAIKIKPKATELIKGSMAVFSASSGEQISLFYKEKQHGMFTYFLLKKLQETAGDVTYKDLYDYISINVQKKSLDVNDKEQTPEINVSTNALGIWEDWSFR